jgi:Flp pilus assembly protein TadG
MKRTWRNLLAAREGVAAIEFAIVALPLLTLTLGTLEFGRMMWTVEALQETTIQVARCVGLLASSCASGGAYSAANASTYAQQVAGGWGVTLPNAALTISSNEASGACSGFSEVSISYTFQTVIPGLLSALHGDVLTAQACFPNQT